MNCSGLGFLLQYVIFDKTKPLELITFLKDILPSSAIQKYSFSLQGKPRLLCPSF